jgi:chromosome transmission fidelity protein 1
VGAVSNSEVHIQIAELRQILSNFINVVPGGMAVFFPSYSFLNAIKAEWTACGTMEEVQCKEKG